ncbi:MAG: hypothetical protein RJB13_481 [Pseudomonadota bacterium]
MHQLFKSDGYASFCQHVSPCILQGETRALRRYPELADILHNPDAVARSFMPAHITTSSVILSPNLDSCLLLMHRKIGEWVYPGGHADGDWHLLRSAVRECFEETGLNTVNVCLPKSKSEPEQLLKALCPRMVQRFVIRPHGGVPEHVHYDFIFVLRATNTEVQHNAEESSDIRWFPQSILQAVADGRDGECVEGLDPLTARICLNAMQSARDC